jgi:hypothetical protein
MKTNEHPNGTFESLLFADDLFSFEQDTNEYRVKIQLQRYLNSLEQWFNNWRINEIFRCWIESKFKLSSTY